MNKRELNRELNEIIELRKLLKEKEENLYNEAKAAGYESISTAKGQMYIVKESTALSFSTTRFGFKEKYPDLYNENLIETTRKEHMVIKESK